MLFERSLILESCTASSLEVGIIILMVPTDWYWLQLKRMVFSGQIVINDIID